MAAKKKTVARAKVVGDPKVDEDAMVALKNVEKLFSKGNIKNLDIATLREGAEIAGAILGRTSKYLSIRAQQGYKGR